MEDSLDRKFQDLERRVESFEASFKKQRELFDRERVALVKERSQREMLKGHSRVSLKMRMCFLDLLSHQLVVLK